jgi:hypothetical protein
MKVAYIPKKAVLDHGGALFLYFGDPWLNLN